MPFSPQNLSPQTLRQLLILQMLQEMNRQGSQQQNSGGLNASSIAKLFGSGSAGGATGAAMTQGGASVVPAGSAIPAGYTGVGTSASGGTMVVPTSSLTPGGASATTSTTGAGSSAGSFALPAIVAAVQANNVWEGGLKDIARGRGNRADWTNDALNRTPQGAAINTGLRLLGKRSLGSMMKSGKSQAERIRDDFRGALKESGIADNDYMITLADGSKYNVGLGGKHQLQNVGENIDGRNTRNTWDVDWSNPLSKFTTDRIDPMVRSIYGADAPDKKFYPGHLTGMLVNAVMSNAKNEQDITKNIERVLGSTEFAKATGQEAASAQPAVVRPGKGQVARVSPGMYMNDRGQVSRAMTSGQAVKQNYGNRIPRKGKR